MAKDTETKKAKKPAKADKATTADKGKFAQFLATRKLDRRRLERLQPEDRLIKLNKRRARKAASDGADNVPKETRKPRSGRPVTARALDAALAGRELGGPVKTRILHAVNHLLGLKKEEKVDLKALF
jgi:hypothetical protein